jgi:hypothetical protein
MAADAPPPATPQRVERTGIALVHEGERIFPTEDSAAGLAAMRGGVVNYYFPVEIEVIGGGYERVAEEIFDALRMHIEALV